MIILWQDGREEPVEFHYLWNVHNYPLIVILFVLLMRPHSLHRARFLVFVDQECHSNINGALTPVSLLSSSLLPLTFYQS
jgi:hypothetical protein